MARSLTTRQLLSGVRSLIDEINEAEIDDELDLLPSLNRGLDDAVDILARKYPDALIQPIDVDLSSGVNGLFDIPEDAFQERLEKVEARLNGYYSEVQRIDYRDITPYDVPSSASTPYYYAVIGSQYKLVPPPASIQGLRIWYIPEVGPLVKEYGRITYIGAYNPPATPTTRSYVRVTDVVDPNQISVNNTSLESYVNIVDHRTGKIKASMQLVNVRNNELIFSDSPTRTNVQGRTIVGQLPANVELDDYICPIDGTCIPPMRSPLSNFLITYASAEIKALKLDGDPNVVLAQLKKFEERIDRTWVRREQSLRVGKSSRNWNGAAGSRLWSRTPRN